MENAGQNNSLQISNMKSPPVIVVQLVHIHGPMKGEIREYAEVVISIGRHPSSSLRFPADCTAISRKHAEIRRDGNRFKLFDHSTNGTFVNGKKVSEAILRDGDVLEISEGGPKFSFLTKIAEITSEIDKGIAFREEDVLSPEKSAQVSSPEADQRLSSPVIPNLLKPENEPAPVFFTGKSSVPLVVQYGPTIRTYKELPVTIGKNQKCEFILLHPSILDRHAEVLFHQNEYWIKDLSGRKLVSVNGNTIEFQAPLRPDDEISLAPQGPVFRYVGEGRLAEVVPTLAEKSTVPKGGEDDTTKKTGVRGLQKPKGFFAALFKK